MMKQRKLLALLLSFAMIISFVASGCGRTPRGLL